MIISFQMGDSYNSGSQLGAPVAKEPPLLLCIFLAHLAQSKWGWGGWIMAVAIVSGLAASACSAVSFLHYCKRTVEEETKGEKPIAYNDHE